MSARVFLVVRVSVWMVLCVWEAAVMLAEGSLVSFFVLLS